MNKLKPKENKRNSILMVCDQCGTFYIAKRQDYEKKKPLKDAIWLSDTCAWCQEPGNFYEDQWYYGEKGLVPEA